MNRPLTIWIVFGACLALVLGSMGFVSLTVVRLDSQSAEARRRAALEENVRLALWRMDSALAPLIGRENARPAYGYQAFYPARFAYTRMYALLDAGEVRVPSPLLTERHPHIRLHFQFEPGGALVSPQAPTGNMRDLAESGFASHDHINRAGRLLTELDGWLDRDQLVRLVGADQAPARMVAFTQGLGAQNADAEQQLELPPMQHKAVPQAVQQRSSRPVQQALSTIEFQARNKAARQVATTANLANRALMAPDEPPAGQVTAGQDQIGVMQAVWTRDELLLVRRAEWDDRSVVQGCWLDWPAVRAELLADARELLPKAELVPVHGAALARSVRRLASLPVALRPGELDHDPIGGLSPIQLSLLLAWAFALLAAFAVAVVLRGIVALSERRAAFVSAVTHELRTPLTTFRMYTELLAEGLVTDPVKRQDYYRTLHAEADRLDHLVQNVLAYSRLEKTGRGARVETVRVGELFDRLGERLAERTRQAELQLEFDLPEELDLVGLRIDPEAVGRILFNLVDNASKYARGGADRRVLVSARRQGDRLVMRVRDFGPGIAPDQARRLFQPFSKSSQAAAESAPGVGLGLALSRRLARRMGGDLSLETGSGPGASFALSLPITP